VCHLQVLFQLQFFHHEDEIHVQKHMVLESKLRPGNSALLKGIY
jgi:hypothetical protein